MWFKEYGYSKNPFMVFPFKEKTKLSFRDAEIEDALYHINAGSLLFIESDEGNGVTKFLKGIIDNFSGKIIYVNAEKLKKTLNIEELLRKKTGLFKKKPKGMILIIDNSTLLSEVNFERIKYFYDNNYLKSVIFTGKSFEKTKLPLCLKHRIGKRIIKLKKLNDDQVTEIIFERLESSPDEAIINSEMISEIYKYTGENIKKTIMYCGLAAEEMAEAQEDMIKKEHFDAVKDKINGLHKIDNTMIEDDGTKIIRIAEYYRNPVEDIFCSNCGAIVDLEDTECPECGAEFEAGE